MRTSMAKALTILLMAALTVAGCQSSDTVPVRGKITYAGRPVDRGRITFEPIKLADEAAPRRPSIAPIRADGTFEMTTFASGDGVQPGEYKVIIWSVENEPGDNDWGQIGKTFDVGWLVPEKYARSKTTPLTVTVPPEGELHFELTD